MVARKSSTTACQKATTRQGEGPNGNGRITIAVLGTKLDSLIKDVGDLRKEHDDHVGVGTKVLERLSALEAKWTVLMWGAPIALTIVGVTTSLIFALR